MSKNTAILSLVLTLGIMSGCSNSPDLSHLTPPDDHWFSEQVVNQPTPVLVDFTASWCGPCQGLKPHLAELQKEYADRLKVVEIDSDSRSDLVSYYKIDAYPTLLMMQGGKVLSVCRGAPPTYKELKSWASPHIN